jgi:transcription antitermination factor NusG
MPLLEAEPNVYPASLMEGSADQVGLDRQWSVLHTKPRQEKSLARQLLELQQPFYLPIVQRRLQIRGRRLTSHVPLFPGYLFLLANHEQRVGAMTTNRVVRALPVASQDGLWRDLRQIYQLIASGAPITPEDRLTPGVAVEIRTGPLAGLKGKILRTASGRRFVVEVDFIQRGASVLLDDCCLSSLE